MSETKLCHSIAHFRAYRLRRSLPIYDMRHLVRIEEWSSVIRMPILAARRKPLSAKNGEEAIERG
jgi:hypothetical protein